jgi:DNA polymerase
MRCLSFSNRAGMLFIKLPSGRSLSYVRPRLAQNRFGGESIEYFGIGPSKKWERIESYGPKFVENIVQGISRDLLAEAMIRFSASSPIYIDGPKGFGGDRKAPSYRIVAHVHDEVIVEANPEDSVEEVCRIMGESPPWAEGLLLRADGYECDFYRKD